MPVCVMLSIGGLFILKQVKTLCYWFWTSVHLNFGSV